MSQTNYKTGDQVYLLRPLVGGSESIMVGVIEQSEKGQLSVNGHDITLEANAIYQTAYQLFLRQIMPTMSYC